MGGSTTKIVGLRDGTLSPPMMAGAADPVTSLFGAFGKYVYDNGILLSDIDRVMLTGVGSSGVDSPAVLDMIERQVMPLCTVSQVNLKGTELTLTLSNVSLDTVGVIATNLSGQQGVTNVAVATAQTSAEDGSAQVVATVTVSLLGAGTSAKGGA